MFDHQRALVSWACRRGRAANEAQSADALKAIVKQWVPKFQAAKDTEGYSAFSAAVQKRGAALTAATINSEKTDA
jgi:hypothetical protein